VAGHGPDGQRRAQQQRRADLLLFDSACGQQHHQRDNLAHQETQRDRRPEDWRDPMLVDKGQRRASHARGGFGDPGDGSGDHLRGASRDEGRNREAGQHSEHGGPADQQVEPAGGYGDQHRESACGTDQSSGADPSGPAAVDGRSFPPHHVDVQRKHQQQNRHGQQVGLHDAHHRRRDQCEA